VSSIKLHPEKGVNPKLTYCGRCGGPGSELVLVGADEWVYTCSSCSTTVFGYGSGTCPKCQETRTLNRVRKMEDNEKLPGGLCEACEKEVAEHKAVVEAGGVYFMCEDCGVEGVIKGTAPLAKMAREKLKVEAPKPLGVKFSKKDGCPKCGKGAQ
jgi:hypothetical protein